MLNPEVVRSIVEFSKKAAPAAVGVIAGSVLCMGAQKGYGKLRDWVKGEETPKTETKALPAAPAPTEAAINAVVIDEATVKELAKALVNFREEQTKEAPAETKPEEPKPESPVMSKEEIAFISSLNNEDLVALRELLSDLHKEAAPAKA